VASLKNPNDTIACYNNFHYPITDRASHACNGWFNARTSIDLMERCAKLKLQQPYLQTLFDQTGFFINFIHEFADRFHHAKEEHILFRYLGTPSVLRHCNPVPQMMNGKLVLV